MNTVASQNLLSSRMSSIKPSASMAAKQRVDTLRAEGKTIIDLTIGEPDFDTPEHIKHAAILAIEQGKTKYTSSRGIKPLIEAIQHKYLIEQNLNLSSQQIIVGSGAKQLIFSAFMATLNDGDEVIIPAPFWVSYPEMVTINGGKAVVINTAEEQQFKVTAKLLKEHITERTKWILINTPNNPSGAIYTQKEWQSILTVLEEYPHVYLMVDEIYEHFSFSAKYVSPLTLSPSLSDRILLINGVSKSYAMTGWRIGFAVGNPNLINAIATLISQTTSCANEIGQWAAVAALTGDQQCVKNFSHQFRQRRDSLCHALNDIHGIRCNTPDGSFYAFPNISAFLNKKTPSGDILKTDVDFVNYLIEYAHVAVLDGSAYGMPGHIRISFATTLEQIITACSKIKQACLALT